MTTQSQTPEAKLVELSKKATKAPWLVESGTAGGIVVASEVGLRLYDADRGLGMTVQNVEIAIAARNLAEPMAAVVAAARVECERDTTRMFACKTHSGYRFGRDANRCSVWHATLEAALATLDREDTK